MKRLLPCFILALAGCQTPSAPEPVTTTPSPPQIVATVPEFAQDLRRQRQLVEALMSQNEALQAQLRAVNSPSSTPTAPPTVVRVEPPPPPPEPVEPVPEIATLLMPNADGIIDLVAATALAEGETVNPFVLRQPPDPGQETVITIQGVVRGEHPCALVNDSVLAIGDQLDGLRLARIEPEALYFVIGDFTLRIRVNGGPVRVRRV